MTSIYKLISWLVILSLLILTITTINLTAYNLELRTDQSQVSIAPRGLENDTWPMFRGGPTRVGNTTATGPDYFHDVWSTNFGIWYSSSVLMYDQIYVTYNGGISCLNLSGGTVWSYTAAGTRYGTAMVHNGKVYYASEAGDLYCLDANATGPGTTTRYWLYNPTGVTMSASSPVTDGKMVFYSTRHVSGLHAVWINNGTKAWNASLNGSAVTESSPAYWNGKVYCGGGYSYNGGSHDMFCFNATNGTLIWNFTTGDDICATPAIEYGRVYFGSMDGKVYCLDTEGSNGSTTKYWEFNVGTADIFGSAAVGYGRVYVPDSANNLHCFNALAKGGTTTRYWVQTILPTSLYGVCSSPAITKDRIYLGNAGNVLHCRNRTTGAEIWSKTLTPAGTYGVSSSPVVYKDMLFVTSDNGYLYAVGHDIVPPKVESTNPADEAINVNLYQNLSIVFDEDLDLSTLQVSNIYLKNSSGGNIPGLISADMDIKTVYFDPTNDLEKDEDYTLTVTTGIMDERGNTLDGNGNGVSEGLGIDEFSITFTTVPFYPPSISNFQIPKQTEDVPSFVNLTNVIHDTDTPKSQLILTENSSYAEFKGLELHMLYPEGITYDLINITVRDNMFTVFRHVPVQITPVNDPPEISNIPTQKLTEDILYSLNMADYITDVDTELSVYKLFNELNNKYIEIAGLLVNFTYPNGITNDTVNISLVEPDYTIYIEISVEITPVNDPPIIKYIPAITAKEDELYSLDVDEYISDIDTPIEELEIIVKSVYVTVSGHTLSILYPEGIFNDTLEVQVYDGQYYNSTFLTVNIEGTNDPPSVLEILSPKDGDKFEYDEPIELKASVEDSDLPYGDKLYFYWEDSSSGFIAYTQNATDIILSSGEHTITFTVVDEAGEEDSMSIKIEVKEKPADNDTDPGPGPGPDDKNNTKPDDEESESGSGDISAILPIIAVVVILILVILVVFAVIRKRKLEAEAKKAEEEAKKAQMPTVGVDIDPNLMQMDPAQMQMLQQMQPNLPAMPPMPTMGIDGQVLGQESEQYSLPQDDQAQQEIMDADQVGTGQFGIQPDMMPPDSDDDLNTEFDFSEEPIDDADLDETEKSDQNGPSAESSDDDDDLLSKAKVFTLPAPDEEENN